MPNVQFIILIILVLLGFGSIIVVLLRKDHQSKSQDEVKDLVNQILGESSEKIISQAKHVLQADKESIYKDNETKREVIEKLITDLKQEIDQRQDEIRKLEQDRNKKFGEIATSIQEHRKITDELRTSTQSLSRMLSNNQVRGQWGERIIEDILRNAGLVETVHYQKQTSLEGTTVKPDVTLLLPNQRKVSVDVKFPYAQIQHLSSTEDPKQQQHYLKLFEKDLKDKLKQIQSRGYINHEAGTLDYAIMFVPNEMLFSFINQQFPHIIDEAMNKKIMIVSPFTFLIVARTVMESYKNFMIENNLRKIIGYISKFIEEWERFTKEFDAFDGAIDSLRTKFDKIHKTRYKQMKLRIGRIEEYQIGNKLGEISGGENI